MPGNVRIIALMLMTALMAQSGCDRDAKSTSTGGAPPPSPAKVEHPGTIRGRVMFDGKPPELARLNTTGDAHCQKLHPDGLADESVVVADDGGLANVFVYLKDAPRSNGSAREPALIDQVGCQYVPHALAAQIYQPVRVKSSDPVLHNVHILASSNPARNLSENGPGEQTIRFESAEFMHIRCDVHPWMKATIGVFDSPYFCVSDATGKFTIGDIPPGTYTLAIWHERLGERTQKIIVKPDGAVTLDLKYER